MKKIHEIVRMFPRREFRPLIDVTSAQDENSDAAIAPREGLAKAPPYADRGFNILTAGQC